MSPERSDVGPNLDRDIMLCRIADAQLAMRLSCCPPQGAEQLRMTQLVIRDCIKRMQKSEAP